MKDACEEKATKDFLGEDQRLMSDVIALRISLPGAAVLEFTSIWV